MSAVGCCLQSGTVAGRQSPRLLYAQADTAGALYRVGLWQAAGAAEVLWRKE